MYDGCCICKVTTKKSPENWGPIVVVRGARLGLRLHCLLGQTDIPYHLRTRFHHMTLISINFFNDTDFIIPHLYQHLY